MSRQHARQTRPVVSRIDDRLSLSFDELRVQSEMRLDAPDELVLGYTRTMMGFLLFNPQPARIAMIGLGGGSLLKYCHATLPRTQLTVIEIDPAVIALRERFFVPADDARLRVLCADGAVFVRDAADEFDVLLVDGYDGSGQPPALSTQRFYNDCYQRLGVAGLLVVNLSDLNAGFAPLVARIRHSFNGSVLVVDAEDSTNRIVFAGKGPALAAGHERLVDPVIQFALHPALNLYHTLQALRTARTATR